MISKDIKIDIDQTVEIEIVNLVVELSMDNIEVDQGMIIGELT